MINSFCTFRILTAAASPGKGVGIVICPILYGQKWPGIVQLLSSLGKISVTAPDTN